MVMMMKLMVPDDTSHKVEVEVKFITETHKYQCYSLVAMLSYKVSPLSSSLYKHLGWISATLVHCTMSDKYLGKVAHCVIFHHPLLII